MRIADRYLVEKQIARGGMASVWLATDEVLQRKVAAKVLHPHLVADDVFQERFRVEALAAARLTHPNVVAVYDTGDHDGVPFIVMEHLSGGTLAELLSAQKVLDPDRTARLGSEVCAALAYAHAEEIVHRDIKPGNILFSEGGHIKVADFGIAKAAFADADLTNSGALLGTVRYLSPEQVKGEVPDGRADLYSLGLVLYECATGRPAFSGENDLAIATARLGNPPPRPRDLRPEIPRELDALIMRAIATNPSERFADAFEMKRALDELTRTPDQVPSDVTTQIRADSFVRSEGRWLIPAIVMLVVAALLVGLFALPGPRDALRDLLPGRNTQTQSVPFNIVSAGTYDPEGDGQENEEDARLAVDGDRATSWRTDYYTRAELGGLKEGVGLFIDLGQPREASVLRVVSSKGGWRASIRSSDDGESWSAPSGAQDAGPDHRFAIDGTRRYWMVWMTRLVDLGGGRWAVEVAEIEIR